MIRFYALYLAISLTTGLLFVNIYTSMIDAVSWGSDIPNSIQIAREYYKTVNPGNFFRIFSPLNQLLTLLALIFCWKAGKQIRNYCALALVTALIIDGFTFSYFYPRNEIMFEGPITNVEAIKVAWSEWSTMNWVRSGVGGLNLVFDLAALTLLFKGAKQ